MKNPAARLLHLQQTEVGSHSSYLLNQHEPMLQKSLDCIVITCEPSARKQVLTVVQLLSESHHCHHLRSCG